jgi:gliding motility-associated-like protein
MKLKAFLTCLLTPLIFHTSFAQSCLQGSLNNAILTAPCAQTCLPIKYTIPHLKTSSTYAARTIPYAPFAFTSTAGTELTSLYVDDQYSSIINLPFKVCFYGGIYDKAVVGSNGIITFDVANASCGNAYNLTGTIPSSSGTICSSSSNYFPRASIMGVYTDLDPRSTASLPDRKIEWRLEGIAPCRRLVVSYYKVGMYGAGTATATGLTCNSINPTTFQMVIYEATGFVDIFIEKKACNCTTADNGKATMGVQNFTQDKAVAAPGKNGTIWPAEVLKGYRFQPDGISLFKRAELCTTAGTVLYTTTSADTSTTTPGVLDIKFADQCPTDSSTSYIVKTYFSNCSDPANDIVVVDNFKVNRTPLVATAVAMASRCVPSGTITVTPAIVPGATYTYTLDSAAAQTTNIFNNVPAGLHTVLVKGTAPSCSTYISINVPLNNTLAVTSISWPSGCDPSGAVSLTPKPDSGYAPFYYQLGATGTPQRDSIFKPLVPGTYTFFIRDSSGCKDTVIATVTNKAPLTGTGVGTPSGCTPSGSATATASGGTAPFLYSIDGTNFVPANTFGALTAGTYTITIKDSTNCIFPVSGINVPGTPLTATATTTPSGCTASGTITVTVTPGAGTTPYSYQLGTTGTQQSGNVFTGLATGTYTVIVRDASGCQLSLSANVGSLSSLSATATSTPSGCNPASGTITVTATGTAPFTYKLGTGTAQLSNIFTAVAASSYTVTVTDANGCIVNIPVTVAATPAVVAAATSTPSGCTPADGTVTASGSAGTAPFTYKLDGGAYQPANIFTGVASGSHVVVVKDAVGCTDTVTVTVGQTPQPAGTAATTLSGCTPSGSITITTTAGTAPFTYVLGTTGTPQASNTFNGLTANSYTVTITDAKGCTAVVPATIGQHPALTATGTTTPSGCTPPSGTVTITVPAGAGLAPFTYSLDAATPVASNTFNGITTGPHSVIVRDAAGCSFTVNVQVAGPAPLTGSVATTPSGCTPSGTITVSMTPGIGVAPFQYQLNGTGALQAGNTFNNVPVGTHTVYVTDAVGCTQSFPAVVAPTQPLLATTRTHAPSCDAASNGSLLLLPSTGTAPYQFRINNGPWQVSDSFPNLAAGNYNLQFQDASGCISAAFPATVAPGAPITGTATQTNVSCFGGSNGSATLSLSLNATAPFTFSTNNFGTSQSSNTITGLAAGNPTIWFRDVFGCTNSIQVPITAPTQLVAAAPVITNPLCNGAANGTVTLSATGGTAPYQYSFNNGSFQPAPLFNSGAGSFNAVIRDANSCTVNVTAITLANPAQLLIDSVVISSATCDANGRLIVYASGGTGAYQYQLNTNAFGSSRSFSVPANTYSVTVRDANNCTVTSTGNVVPQISNLTYVHPVIAPICQGTKATITPQTNATGFTWTGPAITPNNPSGSSVDVRPAQDTFYSVIYTLGSCSASDVIPVTVRPAPVPDAGAVTPICFGQDTRLNAAPGYTTYEWSPTTYLAGNLNSPNPNVVRPNSSIRYSLNVIDANGCRSLFPDTVTVQVTPPIIVRLSPADTVAYIGDTLHITASAAANHFQWFDNLNAAPVNMVNPNVPNALLLVERTEVLRVHAWTDQGCAGDGYFYLRAYKGPEIYVPDAFTPNRDGKNDLLRPICVGIQSLSYFRVFNRWGQLMYEYKGENRGPEVYNLLQSNIGWDGKNQGKELGTGTYVWIAEGITKEGKRVSRKGTVTIIQ